MDDTWTYTERVKSNEKTAEWVISGYIPNLHFLREIGVVHFCSDSFAYVQKDGLHCGRCKKTVPEHIVDMAILLDCFEVPNARSK